MRVLALGGVGAVASEATRDLAQYSHFDEIIIGDYALDKAEALASEIGAPRLKVMNDLLLKLPQTRQNRVWAYGLIVEVIGEREGRGITCTYTNDHPPQEEWGGPAAYYKNVGIPLSIAAQMLAQGDCEGVGVLPPELAIPAQTFFDELARRGIKIYERIEEYGPVA